MFVVCSFPKLSKSSGWSFEVVVHWHFTISSEVIHELKCLNMTFDVMCYFYAIQKSSINPLH